MWKDVFIYLGGIFLAWARASRSDSQGARMNISQGSALGRGSLARDDAGGVPWGTPHKVPGASQRASSTVRLQTRDITTALEYSRGQ